MKKLLVFIFGVLLLCGAALAQTTYYNWRQREAVTCNALTDGKNADLCRQTSDNTLWKCVPAEGSTGTCDSAIEWVQVGGTAPAWGVITGTISSQTDLKNALDGKLATNGDGSQLTGVVHSEAQTLNDVVGLGSTTPLSISVGTANVGANLSVTGSVGIGTVAPSAILTVIPTQYTAGSGGDLVYDLNIGGVAKRVHVYTSIGTTTFTAPSDAPNLEVLVVGGGGGGASTTSNGNGVGGGGAGGYQPNDSYATTALQSITVTVGNKGSGGSSGGNNNGTAGGDSVFGTITAYGGGYGGAVSAVGGNGASSGGGGATGQVAGTATQGNVGGIGSNTTVYRGGGGGGSGSVGIAGNTSGNGGSGTANSITGTSINYACGGGGGTFYNNAVPGSAGCNTAGAGGAGCSGSSCAIAGGDAVANSGSGGGGGGSAASGGSVRGGNGGTGIVVVRYNLPIAQLAGDFRGAVSVNTTSSSATLNIRGSSNSSASSSLNITSNNGGNILTILDDASIGIHTSTPTARLDILGLGTTSATSSLTVRNSLMTPIMSLNDAGIAGFASNVGVGTVVPTDSLDVWTRTTNSGIHINLTGLGSGCDANTYQLNHFESTTASTSCPGYAGQTWGVSGTTSYVAGKIGTAIQLNASSGLLSVAPLVAFTYNSSGGWTYDFWFQPVNGSLWYFLHHCNRSYSNSQIYISGSSLIYSTSPTPTENFSATYAPGFSVGTGTWYHVVFQKNANATAKIYVNGVGLETTGGTATSWNHGETDRGTYIGNDTCNTTYYSGTYIIDELRFSWIPRYSGDFIPMSQAYASPAGTAKLSFQNDSSAIWGLGFDGGDNNKLKIGAPDLSNPYLTVTVNGNIGIGTIVPSSLFEVGTQKFNILTGGNAGIGTVAPRNKLEVVGTVQATNIGISSSVPSARLDLVGSGTTSATLNLILRNSSATQLVTVKDDGNIGLGSSIPQAKLDVQGGAYIGIGTANSKFETDGTLVFNGAATVWDDLQVQLDSARAVNVPTITSKYGSRLYTFTDEAVNEKQLPFVAQMPHSWKESSTITPHVHFTGEDTTSCNFIWKLDYRWTNYNVGIGTTDTSSTVTIANSSTADLHNMTAFSAIDGTGKTISSVITGTLSRNSTNAADTCDGKSAYLLQFDLHYEKDTVGSRTTIAK